MRRYLGVTSVGSSGRVSNFANYGDGVDFAAPGTGVLTAWETSEMGYFTGTSVSAAIVTGAIAMELSRQPDLTVSDLGDLLKKFSNEAERPGYDHLSGMESLAYLGWSSVTIQAFLILH